MQLSAAGAAGVAASPRVAGCIRRDGRRPQLGDQVVVLRRLRRRQTQLLICALQIAHLGVGQEVQNGAAVGVLILHDVAGGVLHGVPRVTRLRRHIIPHALDAALGVAAIMLS